MVTVGKTIATKRAKPESDSERERVRKNLRKTKVIKVSVVVLLIAGLGFLSARAFQEWYAWVTTKEEVIEIPKEPTIEIIDDMTGQVSHEFSTRIKEYIAELEEEFAILGYKVVRARIPADKTREVDLEIEGFSGLVKVSIDRNAAVEAEDAMRMMKYLEEQGITEVQYIDVRVERKGYYK